MNLTTTLKKNGAKNTRAQSIVATPEVLVNEHTAPVAKNNPTLAPLVNIRTF
jgi:hypothetical protein